MFKYLTLLSFVLSISSCFTQSNLTTQSFTKKAMTPELLWQVKRIAPLGFSSDGQKLYYKVNTPNMGNNDFDTKYYEFDTKTMLTREASKEQMLQKNKLISPTGNYQIELKEAKIEKVNGSDFYPDLQLTSAKVYRALDYRHWDTWNEGNYNHVFLKDIKNSSPAEKDIMDGQPFNCPQKPFGGEEDVTWSPDGSKIVYVSKKLSGTSSVVSTNTDLYSYDLASGKTEDLTSENKGYDTHPEFSKQGMLAYQSMKRDGYEADKNDIIILKGKQHINLTQGWDGTVDEFEWSADGKTIYFVAPINGTQQLFSVNADGMTPKVQQLTTGEWDVQSIIDIVNNQVYVTKTDMNHAAEIFSYDLTKKTWTPITHVNDTFYEGIAMSKIERRYVTTTDGKQMLVWMIYPPDFDKNKKYPTLLYCQGGPQSALSQFYSFRWNFQLMAGQGYIIVAPNRRGMPGHGTEWNEQISGDWGGQNIQDYLSAIDDVAKEPYVDSNRLGAIGASYGGYSVYYLAGIHNGRFKSFIAHDGAFNLESMYGSTEEIFFVNFDYKGPYWDKSTSKTYTQFNPMRHVDKWNTPIYIIQGDKDFRIPTNQALEAFTAAQLKGIKSKLLFFPDENHWVMKPQNGLVWQREFYSWLDETLK
ncbi:MAG: S9 family peptidase [Lewinellaceae bacterium]|nr:S9 family peptidase [Lewinellaceae bacterium]